MLVVFAVVSFLFLIQFVLALLYSLRSQSPVEADQLIIDRISIIIPFHNEELRIQKLLQSLNNQIVFSERVELIFVDDHSTDKTVEMIKNNLKIPYRIVSSESNKGKKYAIHQGVLYAQHEYILTLDADVELNPFYLEKLVQCSVSDLTILPVEMTGTTIFEELSVIEFKWLQILTFGSKNPILCNGANLLFSKLEYLSSFRSRTDFDLASGDDAFLLQNFMRYKRRIARVNTEELTVRTESPHTLSELLKQRKRWIGKFNRMADKKSVFMLLILIVIQLAFIASLILTFYNVIFVIPLALKFISETILLYDEKSISKPSFFLVNILHHFWYPVYLILLLFPVNRDLRWEH
jgi:glycosyltransferase involved in cell wall biosynthesis